MPSAAARDGEAAGRHGAGEREEVAWRRAGQVGVDDERTAQAAPAETAASSASRTAAPWPRRGSATCCRRRASIGVPGATTKVGPTATAAASTSASIASATSDARRLRAARAGALRRCRGREQRRSPSVIDTTAVKEPAGPDNAPIAERLETLAALLDLAGASSYSVRAYRRAAELIRATPAPVAELVRQGRVRRAARGRPVDRGAPAGARRDGPPARRSTSWRPRCSRSWSGSGAWSASARSGWSTSAARSASRPRRAARGGAAGRLRDVPGIGAATEAKIAARLAEERPAPRHGLILNRAHALAEGSRRALGGDRRRRPASLARAVGPARRRRRRRGPARVLDRFAALPEIVAVLEREPSVALGVTVDGVPVESGRRRRPSASGRELVRATGTRRYVASLGALPAATDEERRLRGARTRRSCRPSCARRLRGERRLRSSSSPAIRGDVHVHTTWSDGKASRARDGPRRRARSATTTSRSATTRRTSASCRGSTPRTCAARRRRSRRRTNASRRSASCAGASATSSPTAPSTCPTTSSTSSSGCRHRCTPASGSRASS